MVISKPHKMNFASMADKTYYYILLPSLEQTGIPAPPVNTLAHHTQNISTI
jgi:hypothetical protein